MLARILRPLKLEPAKLRRFSTVAEQVQKWQTRFEEEKVPEASSSARNLVAHVLETRFLDDVEAKHDLELSREQLERLEGLCLARLARMPVQYIIGEWEFRGLKLQLIPPVFIPRPETEELVEKVLDTLDRDRDYRILEVGSGSGAISVSLLKELPRARAWAVDQSQLACGMTRMNAQTHGVLERLEVVQDKVSESGFGVLSPDQKFDLIVSNPPYVPTQEVRELDDDVKVYEDIRALDGGKDGLQVIRWILGAAETSLQEEGSLWLEVHPSHPELISKFLEEKQGRLRLTSAFRDFCDKERFVRVSR